MKTRIIFISLLALIMFSSLACGSGDKKKKGPKGTEVRSMADINRLHGKEVSVYGKFGVKDAGKTHVTYIELADGTRVIFSYSRARKFIKEHGDKTVEVTGRIYKSYPPSKEPQQRLMAPHITGVSSVLSVDPGQNQKK